MDHEERVINDLQTLMSFYYYYNLVPDISTEQTFRLFSSNHAVVKVSQKPVRTGR